jgi:hypothetical protein
MPIAFIVSAFLIRPRRAVAEGFPSPAPQKPV